VIEDLEELPFNNEAGSNPEFFLSFAFRKVPDELGDNLSIGLK
jgi:hypothetical protein